MAQVASSVSVQFGSQASGEVGISGSRAGRRTWWDGSGSRKMSGRAGITD